MDLQYKTKINDYCKKIKNIAVFSMAISILFFLTNAYAIALVVIVMMSKNIIKNSSIFINNIIVIVLFLVFEFICFIINNRQLIKNYLKIIKSSQQSKNKNCTNLEWKTKMNDVINLNKVYIEKTKKLFFLPYTSVYHTHLALKYQIKIKNILTKESNENLL